MDSINRNADLIRVDDKELIEWLQENNSTGNFDPDAESTCWECGSHEIGLGGLVQTDGRIAIKFYCAKCHRSQSGALRVPEIIRNAIGLLIHKKHQPCQVQGCGQAYSQAHHILPKSVDWDLAWIYPTVNLCVFHHRLWHDMTGIATGHKK